MHNALPTYEQRARNVCSVFKTREERTQRMHNLHVAHWSAFGILCIKMEGIGTVFMIK